MRKVNPLPSCERLNELLEYDPETGIFTRKEWRGNTAYAGTDAGTICGTGYLSFAIDGKRYQAHRIAWKMVHGSDPVGDIDHIDCDKTNNAIANLRCATPRQNQGNINPPKHNTSGYKGVSYKTKDKCWVAQIKRGNKKIWLGQYKTLEDAAKAYAMAAKQEFGEFARLGEGL